MADGDGTSKRATRWRVAMQRLAGRVAAGWQRAGLALALAASALAHGGLPDFEAPDGVEEGDYIGIFQAFAVQIASIVGLIIAAVTFFIVGKNMISKYSEISAGRASWGDLGMHAAVGVVLLVVMVFLMNQASDILATDG